MAGSNEGERRLRPRSIRSSLTRDELVAAREITRCIEAWIGDLENRLTLAGCDELGTQQLLGQAKALVAQARQDFQFAIARSTEA